MHPYCPNELPCWQLWAESSFGPINGHLDQQKRGWSFCFPSIREVGNFFLEERKVSKTEGKNKNLLREERFLTKGRKERRC